MAPVKKTTKKAPGLLDNPDYLQLKRRVDNLEALVEVLLYDVNGERGEKLRKRFYNGKV